ncbi:hypothetical protein [Cytobacillus purgationiresistens]|nr:hypothetical protein [Cytobacillus purgationiresistens]
MRIKNVGETKIVGFHILCEGEQYPQEIRKVEKCWERKSEISHSQMPDVQMALQKIYVEIKMAIGWE